MIFKSNPADAPRPLPLQNIRSPSAGNEGPGLQRINPNNSASAAGQRIANAKVEAAMIESRFTYTPEHRAAVSAAFEEARAWRRGAEAAATEEMQREAAAAYSQACIERER